MTAFETGHSLFEAALPRSNEAVLIKQYSPLVFKIVHQLRQHAGSLLANDDMVQLGMMALLDTLRRYPGELDEGFVGHAAKRIRGAILDELRRLDWRSRQIRQEANRLRDTARALQKSLGRDPNHRELASAHGISMAELHQLQQATEAETLHSLDALLEAGGGIEGSDRPLARVEQQRWLAQALTQLPEQDRLVLSLYYQHELNMKEIAAVLQRTEARVSQLHKQAVARLQVLLQ